MLSIVMNTARPDYPMVGLPDTFIFEPTVRSLNQQEWQNFELVIIDAYWSDKRRQFLHEEAVFPVTYLDAHPNRYLKHGMVAIASMKNKGIATTEHELVVFLDDCTELVLPYWTQRIEELYQQGHWPMSLTYRYEAGEKLRDPAMHDSRAPLVEKEGSVKPQGDWFYGGSSATKAALIEINGVDESFDGSKSLEDDDTGKRLAAAGYASKPYLETTLHHVEHQHIDTGPGPMYKKYSGPTPKCNYGILLYNAWNHRTTANTTPLTRETCLFIRNNVCPQCPNMERCSDEELGAQFFIESEGFETWLELQQTFDLEEKYA